MRIISLALRQRIFGAIRTEGTCTLWCGDPKDALIFRGKKHQVHEIAFHLFSAVVPEVTGPIEILPCPSSDRCIAPNHLGLHTEYGQQTCPWKRMKIGLCDRKDISDLYTAGVSKRTLKQWYMLETKELDCVLRTMK